MTNRMLVTGAYGFVGTPFVAQAQSTYDVKRIARSKRAEDDLPWDLADPRHPTLPDAHVVVHIASLTAKERADRTPLDDYRRHNVTGTKNLLAALPSTVRYFLYVSTADVYGHGADAVITEDTPVGPQTHYAESKLEAEGLVVSFCTAHGIPHGIARLGLIYGPGEAAYKKAIPTFIELALAGEPLALVGEGTAKRQYLYVDDLARALLLMIRLEVRGVLNLVGSTAITVGALAKLIIDITKHTAGIHRVEPRGPEVDVLFDSTRLSKLGFAEAVDIEQGLRREIDWYRTRRYAAPV